MSDVRLMTKWPEFRQQQNWFAYLLVMRERTAYRLVCASNSKHCKAPSTPATMSPKTATLSPKPATLSPPEPRHCRQKTVTLSQKPATLCFWQQCCRFRRQCRGFWRQCRRFWRHCRWCGRGLTLTAKFATLVYNAATDRGVSRFQIGV